MAERKDKTAEVFAALGDRTRLRLVNRLSGGGPASITQLCEVADVTRQAVTKHLRVLEECGLVESEKRGREQIFSLDQKRLDIAREYLGLMSDRWDSAIDRLKAHLE